MNTSMGMGTTLAGSILAVGLLTAESRAQSDVCVTRTFLHPVAVGTVCGDDVDDSYFRAGGGCEGVIEFDITNIEPGVDAFLKLRADQMGAWISYGRILGYIGDGQISSADGANSGQMIVLDSACYIVEVPLPRLSLVTHVVSSAISEGVEYIGFNMEPRTAAGCLGNGAIWQVCGPDPSCTWGDQSYLDNFTLIIEREYMPDECCSTLSITSSYPPDGTLDPLEDLTDYGVPEGIDQVRVSFSCPVHDAVTKCEVTPASFELTDTAGTPPEIVSVEPVGVADCGYHSGPIAFDLTLDRPITGGEWTTLIAYVENSAGILISPDPSDRIDLAFLPGDVNSSGVSEPSDVLVLIDAPNEVEKLLLESTDINRSGETEPSDVLRLIDLLNGVNTSRPWIGVTVPDRP